MPAPASLEVSVDNTEYSRYETASNTITATVVAVGGPFASDMVRVELVKARRDRNVVVAEKLISLNGAGPLEATTSFYLPSIVDSEDVSSIRFGKYLVRATSVEDSTVYADSVDFDIRIITVAKFKEDYLFGIRLTSTEFKAVKFPPASITGVQVTEVSKQSLAGFGSLRYTYATGPVRTLSWKNGPAVTINAPGTYILKAGGSNPLMALSAFSDYIVVKINSLAMLPTTTITEDLLIEEKNLNDSMIASYLEKTIAWLENDLLWVYLEPTLVATDIEVYDGVETDYDFLVSPLTYFAPQTGWLSINTPYLQLIRVERLWGTIASTRVIDIDLHWVQIAQQGGLVQLVPFAQNVAFNYLGLMLAGSINSASELPNFWHFNMLAGLRETPADLRDLIAKKAAMDLLGILGAALRPGVGSVSLSRDGVSESVSYLAAQKYGNYTGLISLYKDQLDKEIPRFRAKYRGSAVAIV